VNLVHEDCVTERREISLPVATPDGVYNQQESGLYTQTPSGEVYIPLLEAFTHFNKELFGCELPDCLLTVRAKGRTRGFYHAKRFAALKATAMADEIALNPGRFSTQSLKEIAGTFVHEMVHLWQHHFGEPGRHGYHNKQWAAKMREIGLMPSNTGAVDGKQTGFHVSHYIVDGGAFAQSYARLEASGWRIGWGDAAVTGAVERPKPTRAKHVCPGCGEVVYGRALAKLLCRPCNRPLTVEPAPL
jgi:hypothetical protein